MTQKLWLKKPKLNYSNDVIDIIQFGSSMIEDVKPNDIDITVIFKKIPLKTQLDQAQKIKNQLIKETELPIHIKSFDLYSFLDKGNFAKDNILFYGKSLLTKKYFSELFNLKPRVQIYYNLEKLDKNAKVRLHYALKGRTGNYGLLRKYGGKLLRPGLIEVSPEYEKIFAKAIKKITADFKVKKVLY